MLIIYNHYFCANSIKVKQKQRKSLQCLALERNGCHLYPFENRTTMSTHSLEEKVCLFSCIV